MLETVYPFENNLISQEEDTEKNPLSFRHIKLVASNLRFVCNRIFMKMSETKSIIKTTIENAYGVYMYNLNPGWAFNTLYLHSPYATSELSDGEGEGGNCHIPRYGTCDKHGSGFLSEVEILGLYFHIFRRYRVYFFFLLKIFQFSG